MTDVTTGVSGNAGRLRAPSVPPVTYGSRNQDPVHSEIASRRLRVQTFRSKMSKKCRAGSNNKEGEAQGGTGGHRGPPCRVLEPAPGVLRVAPFFPRWPWANRQGRGPTGPVAQGPGHGLPGAGRVHRAGVFVFHRTNETRHRTGHPRHGTRPHRSPHRGHRPHPGPTPGAGSWVLLGAPALSKNRQRAGNSWAAYTGGKGRQRHAVWRLCGGPQTGPVDLPNRSCATYKHSVLCVRTVSNSAGHKGPPHTERFSR